MAHSRLSGRLGLAQAGLAQLGIETNPSGPGVTPQSISIAAVLSVAAVGSIALIRGFVVSLPAVSPVHSVGSISLGISQGVQLAAVGPVNSVGIIRVVGGTVKLRIYIGGVERTNYLLWTEAATAQSSGAVGQGAASSQGTTLASSTRGRWQATFSLFVPTGPGTWGPNRGQSVRITDFGRLLFNGYLIDVSIGRQLGTVSANFFNCTATDLTSICDHRVVTQADFPAGTDVADIFRSIAASFLNGEGIGVGQVPASIGTTASDLPFNFATVTQAFDQATALINATWWVDSFGNLQLSLLADCPVCPFSLTETSYNWRSLVVGYLMADYRNTQYVRSNLSALPSQSTVTGITFSWTVQQAAAAARGMRQGVGILPGNADSLISLTVNGVAKTVYYGQDPETYDTTNPLYGHVWWMFQGTNIVIAPGSATSVPNPPEKPSIGDVIVVNYIPSATTSTGSSITSSAATPFQPEPLPGNTAQGGESFLPPGSGIWENVQQVNDITSISDLQAIAEAMLARYDLPPVQITFETDVPGAAVGQLLSVNIPLSYLPSQQLIITGVQGTSFDSNLLVDRPSLAFDGLGSSMRWEITAGADIGDWVKWFESLILRTEHPNPVIRRELPTFILSPGGSVSSGTASTNPYVVQNTGMLASGYVVAGVPPTNQTLVIDILSANLGGQSILKAPFQIPSGDGSLIQTVNFYLNPAYLFVNDVLSISASYTSIGANPVPAGSVSVGIVIEW